MQREAGSPIHLSLYRWRAAWLDCVSSSRQVGRYESERATWSYCAGGLCKSSGMNKIGYPRFAHMGEVYDWGSEGENRGRRRTSPVRLSWQIIAVGYGSTGWVVPEFAGTSRGDSTCGAPCVRCPAVRYRTMWRRVRVSSRVRVSGTGHCAGCGMYALLSAQCSVLSARSSWWFRAGGRRAGVDSRVQGCWRCGVRQRCRR